MRTMASPGFAFAAIGLNHGHIYGQVDVMLDAGCRLKSFHAPEDDLAAAFSKTYPDAQRVADERAILEDPEIRLVVGAGILDERAPMAVRAMRHGKDVMLDKPGATTLEQLAELRRVQAETGRILSILYSRALHPARHGRRRRTGEVGRDRPGAADRRSRSAQGRQLPRGPTGSGAASGPVASSATSARIRSSSSCSSPAREGGSRREPGRQF